MASKKVIYTKSELQFCYKEIQDNFVLIFLKMYTLTYHCTKLGQHKNNNI